MDGTDVCVESATTTTTSILRHRSTKAYEGAYKSFIEWTAEKNIHSYSENILLAYFTQLAEKYKATSLWTVHSMLRSKLNIHHNIEIDQYKKLKKFLKSKSEGYSAKKAKTFSAEQMNNFINNADDKDHLLTKVALIIGVMGACRCTEMKAIKFSDVEDLGSAFSITILDTKTKIKRNFSITDTFYNIIKKYIGLRSNKITVPSFFINYQNGKCTNQSVGINKLTLMGRIVAKYLNVSNPDTYTGHSFRRSSALIAGGSEADICSLKRYSRWKNRIVAEELINDTNDTMDTDDKNGIMLLQDTSSSSTYTENVSEDTHRPIINMTNCTNCTVHIHYGDSLNK